MDRSLRAQIKLNSWLWPGAAAGLLALEIAFPYRGWLVLLLGFSLVWLVGLLWARNLARNLELVREIRFGWAQVGDLLEERFLLVNRGWTPVVWVEVRDHSTIPEYRVSYGTGVEGRSTNARITRQVCSRRGLFILGPTTLISGDPFGVYTVTLEHAASASILVTPPVLPFPAFPIAASGQAEDGRLSRKTVDASPAAAGVREYHPGDSLRRLHWPTSARRGAPFVKTASALPSGDWWVILDLDERAQAGEGAGSTVETAVLLAAAVADRGLRSGFPVGLAANSREPAFLPPRLGQGQRLEILQALAKVAPGEHSLAELLESLGGLLSSAASLIVITASTHPVWLAPLTQRALRGAAPTVLLIDPAAFGGSGEAASIQNALAALDVPCTVITPRDVPHPDLSASAANRWEWRQTPSGRVIAIHQPADTSWKLLR